MSDLAELQARIVRFLRALSIFLGIGVFALGLLVAFVPGAEGLVPAEALIRLLGSDYVVVAAVGVVAVAAALLVLTVQAVSGVRQADLPVVESVESAPHPGRAVDAAVDGGVDERDLEERRRRLWEAAVRTLMRSEHCSRSDAERRVDAGEWTDDEVAADFLAGDDGGLLRTAVSDEDRTRRTAEAIADVAEDDDGADRDAEPSGSTGGIVSSPSEADRDGRVRGGRGHELAGDGGRGGR